MICPRCGVAMRMTEKDTSSGRDIREYVCDICGYRDWEDHGIALWQAISDAREKAETPGEETDQIARPPHSSLWNRLLARFGG